MKRNILIISILLLSIGDFCYAHDDKERIDALEKRVAELEDTLSNIQILLLAIMSGVENDSQETETDRKAKDALKAKWRMLKTGMSPNEVREILGEPERLNGGTVATWHYPRGHITFMSNKVHSWVEPSF